MHSEIINSKLVLNFKQAGLLPNVFAHNDGARTAIAGQESSRN